MSERPVAAAYSLAREKYAGLGVDTEQALERLGRIPISLHSWQGDDVVGFEDLGEVLGSGLAVTGRYPGRARNGDELRSDLDEALSLIPGEHRVNLQAFHAETDGSRVARNEIQPAHFSRWLDWAQVHNRGLDFNPSCFGHPLSADGFTLSSPDPGIRRFWIEHCIASRRIGGHFGRELGSTCITNIWIPDGYKDTPVDRKAPRDRLRESLDEIFAEQIEPALNRDALEGKLFGIGVESYTVGSHEFYLGYATRHNKLLCMDTGHYHPTEVVADKLSAVLMFVGEVFLHISRGVRWDSDHVVTLTDELQAIMQEIVRGDFTNRVHIGLDFFDASINRVAAWVIGARSTQKALLMALLEPLEHLRNMEVEGDYSGRLALLEALKSMPFGRVWDRFCLTRGSPLDTAFMDKVRLYERSVLSRRT